MPPVANSTSCRKEGVAMSLFLRVLALSGCLIVPFAPTAAAFETSTHSAINQGAARAPTPPRSRGGPASWLDARAAFHRALTPANLGERQQAFADAFRILGQVMHLVADMASVPHTRDDSHLLGDGFERFMGDRRNAGLIGGFARPPPPPGRAAPGGAGPRAPIPRPRGSPPAPRPHPPAPGTRPPLRLSPLPTANLFTHRT